MVVLIAIEEKKIVKIDVNSSYPEKASYTLPGECIQSIKNMPGFNTKYKYLIFVTISYKERYETLLAIIKYDIIARYI